MSTHAGTAVAAASIFAVRRLVLTIKASLRFAMTSTASVVLPLADATSTAERPPRKRAAKPAIYREFGAKVGSGWKFARREIRRKALSAAGPMIKMASAVVTARPVSQPSDVLASKIR